MNITLIILVIEVAVVCLGIVALLFYFRWKKKKNTTAEFEKLLDNVSSQEEERKAYLIQHLVDGYAMSSEAAVESGEYMIEAEKQFLQQFMKQQIERSSVADFYQNLCELLDQYLYFIPSKDEDRNENGSTDDAATVEQSLVEEKNKNEEEEIEESSSEQVEATTSAETDLIDEEQKNDSEEKEEEPDWGDAFAESGDAVDEATKDGFDAENKE